MGKTSLEHKYSFVSCPQVSSSSDKKMSPRVALEAEENARYLNPGRTEGGPVISANVLALSVITLWCTAFRASCASPVIMLTILYYLFLKLHESRNHLCFMYCSTLIT